MNRPTDSSSRNETAERYAFEDWLVQQDICVRDEVISARVGRGYMHPRIEGRWQAWLARARSSAEAGGEPLYDGGVRVVYANDEPKGVRDDSGFICHFHRVTNWPGQDERYRKERALRSRQAEAIALALRGQRETSAAVCKHGNGPTCKQCEVECLAEQTAVETSESDLYDSSELFRHVDGCPIGWLNDKLIRHRSVTDADVKQWIVTLRRLVGIRNPEGLAEKDVSVSRGDHDS